jgi:hypothetical protein
MFIAAHARANALPAFATLRNRGSQNARLGQLAAPIGLTSHMAGFVLFDATGVTGAISKISCSISRGRHFIRQIVARLTMRIAIFLCLQQSSSSPCTETTH